MGWFGDKSKELGTRAATATWDKTKDVAKRGGAKARAGYFKEVSGPEAAWLIKYNKLNDEVNKLTRAIPVKETDVRIAKRADEAAAKAFDKMSDLPPKDSKVRKAKSRLDAARTKTSRLSRELSSMKTRLPIAKREMEGHRKKGKRYGWS